MLGRLNTKMDSFDDRMIGTEDEIGRIQRHWNVLVSDAELEEEKKINLEMNKLLLPFCFIFINFSFNDFYLFFSFFFL